MPSKFTLRFQRRETHELLRTVADRLGISMNSLIEEMISRELPAFALSIEQDSCGTLELIQAYRGENAQAGLDAFARAETSENDPVGTQMARNTLAQHSTRSGFVREIADRKLAAESPGGWAEIEALLGDPVRLGGDATKLIRQGRGNQLSHADSSSSALGIT